MTAVDYIMSVQTFLCMMYVTDFYQFNYFLTRKVKTERGFIVMFLFIRKISNQTVLRINDKSNNTDDST